MTITYLTGTRHPSAALKRFLPDYIDLLLQRGESLLTTNKPGVDRLIIRHCDQHNLPLQVYELAADSRRLSRSIKVASDAVQVQRIVSPTWQRFRHLRIRSTRSFSSTRRKHAEVAPDFRPVKLSRWSVLVGVLSVNNSSFRANMPFG